MRRHELGRRHHQHADHARLGNLLGVEAEGTAALRRVERAHDADLGALRLLDGQVDGEVHHRHRHR